MAKIFKISGYFVDPNGDFDALALAVTLRETTDLIDRYVEVEEVDLPGEWDDDNPLNRRDCPVSECKKYFEEASEIVSKEIAIGDTVRVVDKGYVYNSYRDWIKRNIDNPFLAVRWAVGRSLRGQEIGVVKCLAPHGAQVGVTIAYIQIGDACYMINVAGLEKI